MKKILSLTLLASSLFLLGACQKNNSQPASTSTIHYSAAASLKDALTEIKTPFEKKHPGIHVLLDFGGSGAIREKVVAGAPIDGVLFASKKDTDTLVDQGKLIEPQEILKNQLVLITNQNNDFSKDLTTALEKMSSIAIGNPKTVPAGNYASQTLESLKLTDKVKEKLVEGSDVRQVLSFVEAGNAEGGFVYQTDALLSSKVKVLKTVPENLHEEILYYTGVIKDSKEKKAVEYFNDFLKDPKSQEILTKYGFSTLD